MDFKDLTLKEDKKRPVAVQRVLFFEISLQCREAERLLLLS